MPRWSADNQQSLHEQGFLGCMLGYGSVLAVRRTRAKLRVLRQSYAAEHLIARRRIPSKFDLRRFCRAVGAAALVSLGQPRADELGYAGLLEVREVGGANVTVLAQASGPPCWSARLDHGLCSERESRVVNEARPGSARALHCIE